MDLSLFTSSHPIFIHTSENFTFFLLLPLLLPSPPSSATPSSAPPSAAAAAPPSLSSLLRRTSFLSSLLRRTSFLSSLSSLPSPPFPPTSAPPPPCSDLRPSAPLLLAGAATVGCMDIPDDIFGESLNLEDTHLNEGFQEGYETGFASGKDDGREVGVKTGFITGEELGFYRGCIDVWNSVIRVEPTCFSARVRKNIKEMDELVSKYPILEPENESVTDIMGSLRVKFRAICATLNVKLEYNGYPKASDPNEIQF